MVKKYFARANTSSGCVNFMGSNIENAERIFIVNGKSESVKTEVMRKISEVAQERFDIVEEVVNPFDIRCCDGVIIPDIKTAVINEHCAENETEMQVIDTDRALGYDTVDSGYVAELEKKSENALKKFYEEYKRAKIIHDEWEKIYIERIDFKRLNAYCDGMICGLIGNAAGNRGKNNPKRFFGASTVDGSVNYIDNLTLGLNSRCFIKGRPGTGKSTFLKKLVKNANDAGFDTEVYYCSFDKNSLDMVIVPALSFCVFDSTKPHELFPSREGDKIFDFYSEAGLCGTDERYSGEIEEISGKYGQRISEGLVWLRLSKLAAAEREFYLKSGILMEELKNICKTAVFEVLGK